MQRSYMLPSAWGGQGSSDLDFSAVWMDRSARVGPAVVVG